MDMDGINKMLHVKDVIGLIKHQWYMLHKMQQAFRKKSILERNELMD